LSVEYERYLERLNKILYLEVAPKTAIFDYFTEHMYARDQDANSAEPLMWFIQSGLYSDITFSLFRLIDEGGDRNIYDFLDHAEESLSSVRWKTPLTLADISKHRSSLDAIKPQMWNLKKRRNKFFGHYDKAFFYEPDRINAAFPFSNDDAKTLVRTLQGILSAHTLALNGTATVSVEGFFYLAAERLFEKLQAHRDA
jgi:AbiU2